MIAYLDGKLAGLETAAAIIECNGVGYLTRISLNTHQQLSGKEGQRVKLFTYMLVREDAQLLYGFAYTREMNLFEQLLSVQGVGANTALTILSTLSAEELFEAIQLEDTTALKRVKGIGAKSAGRIVLELKDKVTLDGDGPEPSAVASGGGSTRHLKAEVLAALAQLGFPKNVMTKRIDSLLKKHGTTLSASELVKMALKNPG